MINNHQEEREKETPFRPSVFCYSLDFFFLSSYLSIKSINRRRRTNKEMIELWLMNQKKKNTEKSNERYLLWFSTESRLHSLYYSSMQGHCVFMFFIDFLFYCLFAWMLGLLNSPSLPKCYIREQMFAFFLFNTYWNIHWNAFLEQKQSLNIQVHVQYSLYYQAHDLNKNFNI